MKWSIKKKLIAGFLLVSLIFGIASFLSYQNMKSSNEAYDYLVETVSEARSIVQTIQTDAALQSGYYRAFMLYGSEQKYRDLMNEANERIEESIIKVKEISTLQETVDRIESIGEANKEFRTVSNQIMDENMIDSERAIEDGLTLIVPISTQLTDETLSMYNWLNDDILQVKFQETQEQSNQARITLVILSAVATLAAIAAGFAIATFISRPIVKLGHAVKQVASGDLNVEKVAVKSKDEIYDLNQSFEQMANSLREMIGSILSNSEQVAASAEQLNASAEQSSQASATVATAIQEISGGAEETTIRLEKNTSSLKEVSQGVSTISISSANVLDLAKRTGAEAEEGSRYVENNMKQMTFIHQSILQSNDVISSLSQRSKEIGTILDVISNIADQTNLLALNAAIEAARAGENGKGFAVVADEVRKLAEQSQESAKSISKLIGLIQHDTDESVRIMGEVVTNAEDGVKVSQQTSSKFAQILHSTQRITPEIEQVTATVQEISASIDEITHSAIEISKLAQTNSASSEEVAASTEEQLASMEEIDSSAQSLASMAEELQQVVGQFKL
ncbi:methyl-accepting chemotaxis protein [Cytobacillus gottheilii]|uniref:methyl-accepting chemotaxis protein n=1 Tax=Cytobacillus gottheilii TaxID=859144 RepID=UPI0009BBD6B3|nr:methyl-accepting chemotaxis protein [Cytobacillus gottheilii]